MHNNVYICKLQLNELHCIVCSIYIEMFCTNASLIKSLVKKQQIQTQTDLTQIKHTALHDTLFHITLIPCIQEFNNIHTAEILAFIDLLTFS